MFDTMTMTKVLGAGCGSLLVFLLGSWAADIIYHGNEGGHGDEAHAAGYVVEVASASAEPEEEVEIDFAVMMGDADVAKGEKVFSKCKACHKLEDGKNGTGPSLFGIVGAQIASVSGFGYSDVLAAKAEGTWTADQLQAFLESPKAYAPGTKMSFKGLPKVMDRANVIAYLETIK